MEGVLADLSQMWCRATHQALQGERRASARGSILDWQIAGPLAPREEI